MFFQKNSCRVCTFPILCKKNMPLTHWHSSFNDFRPKIASLHSNQPFQNTGVSIHSGLRVTTLASGRPKVMWRFDIGAVTDGNLTWYIIHILVGRFQVQPISASRGENKRYYYLKPPPRYSFRELTYPTFGKKQNHLPRCVLGRDMIVPGRVFWHYVIHSSTFYNFQYRVSSHK